MKVLVSDNFSPEGLAVFEQAEGIELHYRPGISPEELLREIADADALVVRGGTQVSAELFHAAQKLRVVGRAGIGVENMNLDAANRKGVVVMNTPTGSTTTMAEHTIAMMLALARNIPQACNSTRAGNWEMNRFVGVDLAGKTLGVIGASKIGRMVVERALAMRMQILIYDPYLSEETVRQGGAEPVSFDELLERSDFLTLHLPLNWETQDILDAEALSKVKPGCRIVNCAMGGLIDEEALAEAILQGRVAGAAVDVFAQEPPEKGNPLLGLDQVICTPHLRASTLDAQVNIAVQIARQIVAFLQKGEVINALNVPAISAELLALIRPYVALAERLGSLQAQLCPHGLKSIVVEYAGSITEHPTAPLTMAVLKGLLTPILGPLVNYVNAPHLARERGIRVTETRRNTAEGFSNMIRLTATGAEGERSVTGAVFGENDYRIVRVDDYHVEAVPEGHLLVLHNDDQPGMIGFIGQVLGDAQINVAMMNLSRRKIQGKAISLINVDSEVPEEVLDRLLANPHILSAVQVKLG